MEPLTRDEAERVADVVYRTTEPAVIELLLLATNGDRVGSFKALRALEEFDPCAAELVHALPEREPRGEVERAIAALKFTLYGWERGERLKAAQHFGSIVERLARSA